MEITFGIQPLVDAGVTENEIAHRIGSRFGCGLKAAKQKLYRATQCGQKSINLDLLGALFQIAVEHDVDPTC